MLKRETAIILILLATVILLAHAFVPHHHHMSQICLELFNDHQHDESRNHHENESNTDLAYCISIQTYLKPSENTKQIVTCKINDFKVIKFETSIKSVISDQNKDFLKDVIFTKISPLITTSYSYFIKTSLGLRAPSYA